MQSHTDDLNSIEGFYVGYKIQRSPEPYTFKPVTKKEGSHQHFEVTDLNRYTEYSVVVQAYNSRGAGPPSEDALVRTLEFGKCLRLRKRLLFQFTNTIFVDLSYVYKILIACLRRIANILF